MGQVFSLSVVGMVNNHCTYALRDLCITKLVNSLLLDGLLTRLNAEHTNI